MKVVVEIMHIHLMVMAMHQIGIGLYHAGLLAGMMGHPWKQMKYCFHRTEELLGKYKEGIASASIRAAQKAEPEATIKSKGKTQKRRKRQNWN
eukprot:5618633-Ditylum_brightwellii.AAC.1